MKDLSQQNKELKEELEKLKSENRLLREQFRNFYSNSRTVDAPPQFADVFQEAQRIVQRYFLGLEADPSRAEIAVGDSRYILVKASSLSLEFFRKINELYSDRGEEQANRIARNFLFDIAHLIGAADAAEFHKKMDLKDPVSKLSAGPVHFAFTGWAFVKIYEDSRPSPDKDFYLHYEHQHSFEAEAWIDSGKRTDFPVCVMNAGYSSGWCGESFGIPLTAVELTCKAKGDDCCSFVMAPPDQIERYLDIAQKTNKDIEKPDIPLFFERKQAEEKLKATLAEKDLLLKELHHRVKNNLQIVSSLISMQKNYTSVSAGADTFLDNLKERVSAIGLIHEKLYKADDVTNVELSSYLSDLVKGVHQALYPNERIKLDLDLPESLGKLSIDKAISCGLLINECMSNSSKYAFPDARIGTIAVNARRVGERIYIEVCDDGIGLKNEEKPRNGMGMDLIEALAEQLDGELKITNIEGTRIMLNFPV